MPLFTGTQQQYYENANQFTVDSTINSNAYVTLTFNPLPTTEGDFDVFVNGDQLGASSYSYNNSNGRLTFASSDNQKVTSFFNESVLLAIIGAFDNTSDNTSELSSALGIEDGALPSWTTQLASWAVEDKIDVADMVIAVEYVINQ